MQTDIYYIDPTPKLTIEKPFGRGLRFVVTSHSELTDEALQTMFQLGLFHCGQEMRVTKRETMCVALPCTVVERYTYEVIGPHPERSFVAKRYVYECSVTCDSSG